MYDDYKPPYRITNDHGRVSVWHEQEIVHEYTYRLSYANPPFYAFKHKDKWYALFASDYTATSVMELPSGKVVWSESADG